jgi:hypothetical protein
MLPPPFRELRDSPPPPTFCARSLRDPIPSCPFCRPLLLRFRSLIFAVAAASNHARSRAPAFFAPQRSRVSPRPCESFRAALRRAATRRSARQRCPSRNLATLRPSRLSPGSCNSFRPARAAPPFERRHRRAAPSSNLTTPPSTEPRVPRLRRCRCRVSVAPRPPLRCFYRSMCSHGAKWLAIGSDAAPYPRRRVPSVTPCRAGCYMIPARRISASLLSCAFDGLRHSDFAPHRAHPNRFAPSLGRQPPTHSRATLSRLSALARPPALPARVALPCVHKLISAIPAAPNHHRSRVPSSSRLAPTAAIFSTRLAFVVSSTRLFALDPTSQFRRALGPFSQRQACLPNFPSSATPLHSLNIS